MKNDAKIRNKYKEQIEEILLDGKQVTCLPSSQALSELWEEQKMLRVKLGIDPTNPDLHLGHTVCLHALRKFQKYGHIPVLIIGGFTATVGDPSGRNEARPALSYEQVLKNAQNYLEQVHKILDKKNIEIHNNYTWLSKFNLNKLLELAHIVTVNQLISKEAFGKRIHEGNPLYLHEVLYPLLQGYDSFEVKADIEIGGVDQTFNILFGRHVQKHFKQREQLAVLYPLLIGLDGTKKMSKTFNNYIALNDPPNEIYGKAMSIQDGLIIHYFSLVTQTPLPKIKEYKEKLDKGCNPRDIKMELAYTLVAELCGENNAKQAQENFIKQFQKNEIPDHINEYSIKGSLKVTDLMVDANLVPSKAEAKRLIEGGGVKLKSIKVTDPNLLVTLDDKNSILQIGKRKFVRIV